MDDLEQVHDLLLTEMHRKRLNPCWAKLEILLGLSVAVVGLLAAVRSITISPDEISVTAFAGVALFVLGGYLAMAGHRSHLYQSNNRLIAYLIYKQQFAVTNGRHE